MGAARQARVGASRARPSGWIVGGLTNQVDECSHCSLLIVRQILCHGGTEVAAVGPTYGCVALVVVPRS